MVEKRLLRYAVAIETKMIDEGANIGAEPRQDELGGSMVDFEQGASFVVDLVQHISHAVSECIAPTQGTPRAKVVSVSSNTFIVALT